LKDNNWIEIGADSNNSMMKLTKSQFDHLERNLKNDSEFLRKHGLMDYSLLLGVETIKSSEWVEPREDSIRS
jgi:hypothetical protein